MNDLKKFAAFVAACSFTLMGAAQPGLLAEALSVEEYVQIAIDIAEDDSHGYSQNHRWGPDYDCSSMVITSLNKAGFNTGGAIYTGNMIPGLTANGFEWIEWADIGGTENLKRGDILLNVVHHTEIFLGRDTLVGARGEYGHPDYGDHNGREIRSSPFYDYPWDGILRYKYDVPTSKPSETEAYTYGTDFATGDTVCFSFFSVNAKKQVLEIKKDGEKYKNVNVTDKSAYRLNVDEAGVYTYRLKASNDLGSAYSEEGGFTVYADEPDGLYIAANKAFCAVGDTAEFSFGSNNAVRQNILLDGWWDYYDVTGRNTFSKVFTEPGEYSFALEASNPAGSATTPFGTLVVYDREPYALEVTPDRQFAAAGSCVSFDTSSVYAAEQYLEILKDGEPFYLESVPSGRRASVKLSMAGEYMYRLTAKNKFGEAQTEFAPLSVYDSAPENVSVTSDGSSFAAGSTMTFRAQAKNAEKLELTLEDESGRKQRAVFTDGECSLSAEEAGSFRYTVTASNRFGETITLPQTVNVFRGAPEQPVLTADGEEYTAGEYALLTIEANGAESVTMTVMLDEESTGESIDLTGRTQYLFPLEMSGEYELKLISENVCGTARSRTLRINAAEAPAINENDYSFARWEWEDGKAYAVFDRNTPDAPDTPDTPDTPDSPDTPDAPDAPEIPAEELPQSVRIAAHIRKNSVEPTCDIDGERITTAELWFGGELYTDVKQKTRPCRGHKYALTGWRRSASNEVKAVFACENGECGTTLVDAEVVRSENKQELCVNYTAEAQLDGKTYRYSFSTAAGLMGDVDGDGSISANDALLILRVSVGTEYASELTDELSDVDSDGLLTSSDALGVLRHSTGLSSEESIGAFKEFGV